MKAVRKLIKQVNKVRTQFNHLVVGGNGSGKTTFMILIAIAYLEANPHKRILWVLPDDSERKLDPIPEINLNQLGTFKGMAKIIVEDDNFYSKFQEYFSNKNNNFNGLVINDDPGVFLGRRSNYILALLRRRRQLNVDFLWSFHGWSAEVPKSFFTYVNSIFIMETSDNPEWTVKQLPPDKQSEFWELYNEIKDLCENGKKHRHRELVLRSVN